MMNSGLKAISRGAAAYNQSEISNFRSQISACWAGARKLAGPTLRITCCILASLLMSTVPTPLSAQKSAEALLTRAKGVLAKLEGEIRLPGLKEPVVLRRTESYLVGRGEIVLGCDHNADNAPVVKFSVKI